MGLKYVLGVLFLGALTSRPLTVPLSLFVVADHFEGIFKEMLAFGVRVLCNESADGVSDLKERKSFSSHH